MWSSSNAALATVDSTGLVMTRPSSQGHQVTIFATIGEASGTATLSITNGFSFDSISAGANHTCGLTSDGAAYCWGDNSAGQLGSGTTTNSATPIPVAGGHIFSALSAGGNQTCGLSPPDALAGVLYCWGDNSAGQLGNGTTTNRSLPSLVAGSHLFSAVTVGGRHVCAEPGAYCWGDNSFGQLGNGVLSSSSVPVIVGTGVVNGAAGNYYQFVSMSAGSTHTCGVAQGNNGFITYSAAVCWGDNSFGQLGNGTTSSSPVPVAISGDRGFAFFSAGTLFTCGYNHFVEPSCWGKNSVGQLGNGSTTNSKTPVAISISGNSDINSMSSGGMHACAVINGVSPTGTPLPAYCWGDNSLGQLGNDTATNSATPVLVAGNLAFRAVTAGDRHTCGVSDESGVYCWGDNTFGQLGNNWTTSSSTPVNVAGVQ